MVHLMKTFIIVMLMIVFMPFMACNNSSSDNDNTSVVQISSRDRIIQIFQGDLKTATTVGFFDLRVSNLMEYGGLLPDSLEHLRQMAIVRNIELLKNDIASAKTEDYKEMRAEQLAALEATQS